MKKALLIILFFSVAMMAQFNQYPLPNQGKAAGGLGLNWIDGNMFYSVNLQPELALANFGVGLDLRLDFDKNGKLRKENFNEVSDYISIIRYVRYGLKGDPIYVKLGALDYHTMGHGSIIHQYNNSPSYDQRKSGLVLDIDLDKIGFESIWSSFADAGVVGVRGYARPFKFTPLGDLPFIGGFEIGVSYASDFNKNAGILAGTYNPVQQTFINEIDNGAINIYGFDLGLPIIKSGIVGVQLYADYTKIVDFGSGVSTGIMFNLNALGLVTAEAKLERRFNNNRYIPSYFNSMYEIERFKLDTLSATNLQVNSKIRKLALTINDDNGYYGELGVNIIGLFNIIGSYQRLDKDSKSGILHLNTEVAPEQVPFVVRAGYDKINIQDEKDIFTLDDRSFLYAEAGYKPYPYLLVSMVYSWTFTPVRDNDKNVVDFQPIKRIEPRITFIYPFDLK